MLRNLCGLLPVAYSEVYFENVTRPIERTRDLLNLLRTGKAVLLIKYQWDSIRQRILTCDSANIDIVSWVGFRR